MSKYQIQKVNFTNSGGFVCYPKVMSNDRTWDARSGDNWSHWKLEIDQTETVDLITDAGFAAGDMIWVGIDVVAGDDTNCNKVFTVAQNGNQASVVAKGTTLNDSLDYEG